MWDLVLRVKYFQHFLLLIWIQYAQFVHFAAVLIIICGLWFSLREPSSNKSYRIVSTLFHRWQTRFRAASLRIGYASNIAWAFVFFPVTRLSSILPLVGLTFESSIKYHIWTGQVVMITSALHSIGFIIYWAIVNTMSEVFARKVMPHRQIKDRVHTL